MAVYYALGFEVNTSATSVGGISSPSWSTRAPSYITYAGNSSTISIPSSGYLSELLVVQGKKYVVYPWDMDTNDVVSNGISSSSITWAHNDTSTYSHPDSPKVNFDRGKYVYIWNQDTPPTITYNGTYLPVFLFDCQWNNWVYPFDNFDTRREYHLNIQQVADVDKNYPVTYSDRFGATFLEFYIEPGFEDSTGSVELITAGNVSTYSTYTDAISATNVYDFNRKATTTTSYPVRANSSLGTWKVFSIHNLPFTTYVGYCAIMTGGITSDPVHVNYMNNYYSKNIWGEYTAKFASDSKVHKYYSITTDSTINGSLVVKEIPVKLGKKYTFNLRSYSKSSYAGIVLATATQTYKTSISSYSGSAILGICHGTSGSAANKTLSPYIPPADGKVYLYFSQNGNNGYGVTSPESGNWADVEMIIEDAPGVTVTLNPNYEGGQIKTVTIVPGTEPEDYPFIEIPTRSGYYFQGYFDDDGNGDAYYNSLGEGVKVFDKGADCTLYAHWQVNATTVIFVNLNQNGGTGGQSRVAIKSGATPAEYPSIKIPERKGIITYTFLGYWDGLSSSATQYITATGSGAKIFNKTGQPTFYARWRNNTYFTPANDGNFYTSYSPSAQTIRIASAFGANAGSVTYQLGGVDITGASLSVSDGKMYLTLPASTPVGIWEFEVKLTSTTSYTSSGYIGCTQSYYVTIHVDKAVPAFTLTGQSVGSGTAYVKAISPVAGTVYWGTSLDSMTNTVSLSANTLTTITSRNTTGTTKVYAYLVPTDTVNYNASAIKVAEAIRTTGVTITLDKNGGTGGTDSFVITAGSNDWPTIVPPTRDGFIFLGYYISTAGSFAQQYYYEMGTPTYSHNAPTSNTTLYAVWRIRIIFYGENAVTDLGDMDYFGSVYCTDQAQAATTTQGIKTIQLSIDPVECVVTPTFTLGDSYYGITTDTTTMTVTIPSGTEYGGYLMKGTITVPNGTYNGYSYLGNTRYIFNVSIYIYTVELLTQKYKDMDGTEGYNITTAGTPSTPSPSYSAYETTGSIYSTYTNSISWYQKYSNGTWNTTLQTGTISAQYGGWTIMSETFTPSDGGTVQDITRSHAGSTDSVYSLYVDGQYIPVYKGGSANSSFIHDSMTTNLGTDNVTIRVYNMDDSSVYIDVPKSVTNTLPTTKYLNTNGDPGSTTVRINPSITIGSGMTAGGTTNAAITCNSRNEERYYRQYKSHSFTDLITDVTTGTAYWVLDSQSFTPAGGSATSTTRFAYASTSSTYTTTITVNGQTITVHKSYPTYPGRGLRHTTMGTNVGTDTVTVRAYDAEDTTYQATTSFSIVNEATTGTPTTTYGTPTVSIGSGLTAAGGSTTVTCSVTNTQVTPITYTSGSTSNQEESITGTARWRITNNGNSRFSASGTTYTITVNGSNVTVRGSGATLSHSTMGTNAGPDSVTVTAYNVGDTTKTATASKSISNSITWGNPTVSYSGSSAFAASGGTITMSKSNISISQSGTYDSGSSASNTTLAGLSFNQTTSATGFTYSTSGSGVDTVASNIAANNTTTSAKTGNTIKITATGSGSKTGTLSVSFTQAAGAIVYETPEVIDYDYPIFSAAGGTDVYPSVMYSQTYTWNGVSGSGSTTNYTYDSTHLNPGGTFAFSGTNSNGFTKSTNFATTGQMSAASRGTIIGNGIDICNNLSVVVTLNGKSSSSFTCTMCMQSGNYVTSITPRASSGTKHFKYNNIGPGDTSAPVSLTGAGTYTFSSGGTATSAPSGGTATYSRTYSLGSVQNGFKSVNASNGTLTATSYGTTIGPNRTSGVVTSVLTITFVHDSTYSEGGTVTSSTMTSTNTCTQTANAVTGLSLDVEDNPIYVNDVTSATVTATYTSGANKDVSTEATFDTDPSDIVNIETIRISVDDFNPNEDLQDWLSKYCQPNSISDIYAYTGQTITYNNTTRYLWKQVDGEMHNEVMYLLTSTINYNTLYQSSLEYNANNVNTYPVVILNNDMDAYITSGYCIVCVWNE